MTYTYLTRTISGITNGNIGANYVGSAVRFTMGGYYLGVIESIAISTTTSIVLVASASLPTSDGTVTDVTTAALNVKSVMTLQELIDLFETTYKFECLKKGVTEISLNKKLEASWLSSGIQDILREVREFESYTDLTPVVGTYDYDLPDDFGFLSNVTYNGKKLSVASREQIKVSPYQKTYAEKFAVYSDGTTNHILFDGAIGTTTRVWYSTKVFLYSPSGDAIQSWGSFDGYSFSGDLLVADYYVHAILEYMLSQIFDDRKTLYLMELEKLKTYRIETAPSQTDYHLG